MKALLLLLTSYCCLPLPAQQSGVLRVEPAVVSKEIVVDNLDEDFEDVTSIVVTNNSGRTIELVRETVARRQPRAWTFQTLDRVSRATPFVNTESEQQNGRRITLGPGQSATFYVTLRPDGVTGSGSTELRFSDLTFPGAILATATVESSVVQRNAPPVAAASEAARPAPVTLRLYPNPASDNFFVEAPRNVRIGRVEVTNTLGRQIATFKGESGPQGYDIAELPNGLYLISVFDESGKKVKTLRLLHRQFGA